MAKFDLITTLTLNAAGFTGGINEVKQQTKELAATVQSVEDVLGGIAGFAGGLLAIGSAFEAIKTAINSTQGTAEEFQGVMTSIHETTDKFFQMIDTGDFSNLIENLTKAAKAGTDYNNALVEIQRRNAGLTLEKAEGSIQQKELENVFRDRTRDGQTRMDALLKWQKDANDYAEKGVKIAEAAVKAEENKLKALGVEPDKIKQLYEEYSNGYTDIEKAEKDLTTYNFLSSNLAMAKKGGWGGLNTDLKKAQKEYDDFYNAIGYDEKVYFDLLLNNNKISGTNLQLLLTAYENVDKTNVEGLNVVGDTLRVHSQIVTEIGKETAAQELMNFKLKSMSEAYTEYRAPNVSDLGFNSGLSAGEKPTRKPDSLIDLWHPVGGIEPDIQFGNHPTVDVNSGKKENKDELTAELADNRMFYEEKIINLKNYIEKERALRLAAAKTQQERDKINAEEDLKLSKLKFDNTKEGIEALSSAFSKLGNSAGGAMGKILNYLSGVLSAIPPLITAMAALTAAHKAKAAAEATDAATGAASAVASIPIIGPILAIAAIISMVAALLAIPKFAAGGIVGGTSFSGDKVPILVNSGEGIFTKNQMNNMFSGGGTVLFKFQNGAIQGQLEHDNRQKKSYS